jgi:hypothetical protein
MSNYGTAAGYRTWADARGVDYSTVDDDDLITAALVRSSEYIDGEYRSQFPGIKASGRSQLREWPRAGAYDREGYGITSLVPPVEIENATYEGAKRELASPFSLAPDIKAGGGVVKRVKAGSVEVEYESNAQTQKTFQAIEQALGSLLIVRSSYSGASARA